MEVGGKGVLVNVMEVRVVKSLLPESSVGRDSDPGGQSRGGRERVSRRFLSWSSARLRTPQEVTQL